MSVTHQRPFLESAEQRRRQVERATRLRAAAEDSSLPSSAVVPVDHDWTLRRLWETEVETLQGPCGCRCEDWSMLRLLLPRVQCDKDQSSILEVLVSDTTFAQTVILGVDASSASTNRQMSLKEQQLPPGIHSNALISNCILEPHCRVYRNIVVYDTYLAAQSVLANCGRVTCPEPVSFGNLRLAVGAESGGGREIQVTAESDMVEVCRNLGMSSDKRMDAPNSFQACPYNIIGAFSTVRDTPTLQNVCLAPNCSILAATSVKNAVLLTDASIQDSSTASNVLLQWNASIASHSTVSDALLMEEAHAGPNSLIHSSILGPDVHVSAGEVHASVLGPNTNAHHQSLVIGVLWPLGRGNVGYGANVGSNHTGRLPDQETASGEGTFWGLSTVIKFPVDLTWSPYSIVAAGTTLPPQRVTMPFSLIVETDGVNHILPGWVLQNSPYTLSRSETKFAKRRKAVRHLHYTGWSIVRPSTVDMCIAARDALQNVQTHDTIYKTDRAVVGIGKNCLTEQARQAGIRAYTQCIHRYALHGLLKWIQQQQDSSRDKLISVMERELKLIETGGKDGLAAMLETVSWPILPWEEDLEFLRHSRSILLAEFPPSNNVLIWVKELLQNLVALEKDYAERVYKCKKRDDTRGAKTIPGYMGSHVAAEEDGVVVASREFASKTETAVNAIVAKLSRDPLHETRSRL